MKAAVLLVPGLVAASGTTANPIRRVVNMIEGMLAKVEAEGKAQEVLFNKFMCYCKNGKGALVKSVADAESKVPKVGSAIEETEAEIKQLALDLDAAKTDRADAEASIKEAKSIRSKEAAAYAKLSGDYKTNLAAMGKAITALENGMAGGSFLQSSATPLLRQLTLTVDLNPSDRDTLSAFLSTGQSSSGSGEIVGILKQMKDTMEADLKDAVGKEEEAIASFDKMVKSKTKQIQALTEEIEAKTQRHGEAGVELVELKADLSDTQKQLVDDKKFLAELEKSCATKEGEWAEICKVRAEEIIALHETIKILNSDDALELFKKTLPGSSFLELRVTSKAVRERAASMLKAHKDVRVDLIALALKGKKVSMDKVVKMIDDMVALLGQEQVDDDTKKAYCEKNLDKTEDHIKALELKISDLEKATDEAKESVETLTTEISDLNAGIKKLDEQVATATEQRKEENAEFTETTAANNAAIELLGVAKNRLNKFYNPSQYKESLAQADPGPAPDIGKYEKKSEESAGVIGMIDTLIADVKKEVQEMGVEEKNAQAEYETLTTDAAAKRASDSQSIKDKTAAKADLEANLVKYGEDTTATKKAVLGKINTLGDLHEQCDWLLSNYEARVEARNGEIDALKKAKAVLSGADYSFIQINQHVKQAPEDKLAAEMTHDLEMNFNKIAPFGKEDTAKELQDHAAKTQDTLVDAVENAEVAEIKRAVFRALTRLRAATIKEFDTIARLETQAIDAYNDAHHYRAENPLAHLHEDEAPVETDKLKSFH